MKFARTVIMILVMLIVFTTSVRAFSWPWDWFGDRDENEKKREFHYEFDSGWRVITMKPAWDSPRVRNFDYKVASDSRRLERILGCGNFKLYYEMHSMGYQNWWLMAVDIPSDQFLYIPKKEKISMEVVSEGDTIYINSKRICFCKGWDPREFQHTIIDNSKSYICVRPYKGIGRNDFEHGTVSGYGNKKFIIGYVYFGKDIPELNKIVDFSFGGIKCSEVSPLCQ